MRYDLLIPMSNLLFCGLVLSCVIGCGGDSGTTGANDPAGTIRIRAKEQLPRLVGKRVVVAGRVPVINGKNHVFIDCEDFGVDLGESSESTLLCGKAVTVVGTLYVRPPDANPDAPDWKEIGESPSLVPTYYLKDWSILD